MYKILFLLVSINVFSSHVIVLEDLEQGTFNTILAKTDAKVTEITHRSLPNYRGYTGWYAYVVRTLDEYKLEFSVRKMSRPERQRICNEKIASQYFFTSTEADKVKASKQAHKQNMATLKRIVADKDIFTVKNIEQILNVLLINKDKDAAEYIFDNMNIFDKWIKDSAKGDVLFYKNVVDVIVDEIITRLSQENNSSIKNEIRNVKNINKIISILISIAYVDKNLSNKNKIINKTHVDVMYSIFSELFYYATNILKKWSLEDWQEINYNNLLKQNFLNNYYTLSSFTSDLLQWYRSKTSILGAKEHFQVEKFTDNSINLNVNLIQLFCGNKECEKIALSTMDNQCEYEISIWDEQYSKVEVITVKKYGFFEIQRPKDVFLNDQLVENGTAQTESKNILTDVVSENSSIRKRIKVKKQTQNTSGALRKNRAAKKSETKKIDYAKLQQKKLDKLLCSINFNSDSRVVTKRQFKKYCDDIKAYFDRKGFKYDKTFNGTHDVYHLNYGSVLHGVKHGHNAEKIYINHVRDIAENWIEAAYGYGKKQTKS